MDGDSTDGGVLVASALDDDLEPDSETLPPPPSSLSLDQSDVKLGNGSEEVFEKMLIQKNVALAECVNLRELLRREEEKGKRAKVEVAKTSDLLIAMTEKYKEKQNELQQALEETSECREKLSMANKSIALLREQLEDSLEREKLASSDDESTSGGKEKVKVDSSALAAENTILRKQLQRKEDEIMSLSSSLEKSEAQLASTTGRYMMNSQTHEPTMLETQLVETKLSLAQARSSRDSIAMKHRTLEASYLELKLELAATKEREDDQAHRNEVLSSASARLELELKDMARKVGRGIGGGAKGKKEGPAVKWQRAIKALMKKGKGEEGKKKEIEGEVVITYDRGEGAGAGEGGGV